MDSGMEPGSWIFALITGITNLGGTVMNFLMTREKYRHDSDIKAMRDEIAACRKRDDERVIERAADKAEAKRIREEADAKVKDLQERADKAETKADRMEGEFGGVQRELAFMTKAYEEMRLEYRQLREHKQSS